MIDRVITVILSLVLLVLAYLVAMLGSVHGPENFAYAALGLWILAEVILWTCYHYVRRRRYRHSSSILAAVGILLAAAFVIASQAAVSMLLDWEWKEHQRLAAATEVLQVHDEPLLSAKGNPIGIRLRYSLRFPNSDYFTQTAMLRTYKDVGVSIWADGRFAEPTVTPPMAKGKYGAPRYEQGKQYDFQVDAIPNFLMENRDKTRLCVLEPPAEYREGFEKLMSSDEAIRYRIEIVGTNFGGYTEHGYSPKIFYESALKEGAVRLQGSGFAGSVQPCP